MTTKEKQQLAKVMKLREGLIKIREELLKAYSSGKTVFPTDMSKKYNLYPMTMTWLIKLEVVKEHQVQETGKGVGRSLEWVYKGNVDGVVDQALIEKMLKKEQDYARERSEVKKEKEEGKEIVSNINKTTLKKLPTGNSASMDDILKWVDNEMVKEDVVPGYLRTEQKLMYTKIRTVIEDIRTKIEPLKEAIEALNL